MSDFNKKLQEALDEENEEFDPVIGIIEGAAELGIKLTKNQVLQILRDVNLEADEVSSNQAVIDGYPVQPGQYQFYKGGGESEYGWVSDNNDLAKQHGNVRVINITYNGETTDKWNVVHDWDGYPQLVPPGALLRKVYDGGYIWLR
jgi:hypothetical protein